MMTDKPYTPTTGLMRTWYVLADHSGDQSTEEYEAEFDRWYDAEIREAENRGKEEGWDDVADALTDFTEVDERIINLADTLRNENPYRSNHE